MWKIKKENGKIVFPKVKNVLLKEKFNKNCA